MTPTVPVTPMVTCDRCGSAKVLGTACWWCSRPLNISGDAALAQQVAHPLYRAVARSIRAGGHSRRLSFTARGMSRYGSSLLPAGSATALPPRVAHSPRARPERRAGAFLPRRADVGFPQGATVRAKPSRGSGMGPGSARRNASFGTFSQPAASGKE